MAVEELLLVVQVVAELLLGAMHAQPGTAHGDQANDHDRGDAGPQFGADSPVVARRRPDPTASNRRPFVRDGIDGY